MFHARPRWGVPASGLAVPDRARPGPRPLTSISQAQAAQPLTFIDRAQASLALANPSLLLAGPGPSFLVAGLGQVRAPRVGKVQPRRAPRGGQGRLTKPFLTLAPQGARASPPPRAPSKSGGDHRQGRGHGHG